MFNTDVFNFPDLQEISPLTGHILRGGGRERAAGADRGPLPVRSQPAARHQPAVLVWNNWPISSYLEQLANINFLDLPISTFLVQLASIKLLGTTG